jgi:hypothetical protein
MSRSNGCGSASPRRQRSFSKSFSARRYGRKLPSCAGKESRLGESPAPFGADVAIKVGVLKFVDAAGAGEFVDVGGDPQQQSSDATDVDDDVAALGVVCFRAQVGVRRVLAEVKLDHPACAIAQPLDLVAQPLGDRLALRDLIMQLPSRSSGAGQPYSERSSPAQRRDPAARGGTGSQAVIVAGGPALRPGRASRARRRVPCMMRKGRVRARPV